MNDKQKQCLLNYLGYDTGGVDGLWGAKSKSATAAFQAAYGLQSDGVFGDATAARILEVVASGEQPAEDSTGTFWDDIKFFTREEFRCQCGGKYCDGFPAEPQEKLLRAAEKVREHFGAPMTVSSGVRCPTHNAAVGGVSNSRHLSGKAMDYSVRGKSAAQILAYVQSLPDIRYSYAINDSYVHMDIE